MVDAVVDNLSYILLRRELGDLSGIPYLDEFEQAVERAGLTEVQLDVIERKMQGATVNTIAKAQSRTPQKVRISYALARTKIAEQLSAIYRTHERLEVEVGGS